MGILEELFGRRQVLKSGTICDVVTDPEVVQFRQMLDDADAAHRIAKMRTPMIKRLGQESLQDPLRYQPLSAVFTRAIGDEMKDGDGDGFVFDGTPEERAVLPKPAPVKEADKPVKPEDMSVASVAPISDGDMKDVHLDAMTIAPPVDDADLNRFIADARNTKELMRVEQEIDEIKKDTESGDVRLWSIEKNVTRPVTEKDIAKGTVPFTATRAKLHAAIIEEMLPDDTKAKPGETPQAVLLIGPPGAGKSVAGKPLVEKLGFKFANINNDDVKAALPEYKGWNAAIVHEESAQVVEHGLMPKGTAGKHHMLLDGVGKNAEKMTEIARNLQKNGYDVHLVHVTIPTTKTTERAWRRFAGNAFGEKEPGKEPGRYVPLDYIAFSVAQKPTDTFTKLRDSGIPKSWLSVSNDVPRGTAPITLDKGER